MTVLFCLEALQEVVGAQANLRRMKPLHDHLQFGSRGKISFFGYGEF